MIPNDFCRRIPFVLLRKPSDTFDTWKHGNSVVYDEILSEMRLLRDELYILCDRISLICDFNILFLDISI